MTNSILKYGVMASALFGSFAYADNSGETATNTTTTNTTTSSSPTHNDEQTFGHLQTLDRNIEAAGKEIKALQMESQLQNLKKQAEKMQTNFTVTRIYGVDNQLMASLLFESNTVVDVKAGDRIDDRYTVEKITAKQVTLYDQKDKKTVNAPFNKD